MSPRKFPSEMKRKTVNVEKKSKIVAIDHQILDQILSEQKHVFFCYDDETINITIAQSDEWDSRFMRKNITSQNYCNLLVLLKLLIYYSNHKKKMQNAIKKKWQNECAKNDPQINWLKIFHHFIKFYKLFPN